MKDCEIFTHQGSVKWNKVKDYMHTQAGPSLEGEQQRSGHSWSFLGFSKVKFPHKNYFTTNNFHFYSPAALCICSVEKRNIRSEQCIYCLFVSVFNFYPHHQFSNEIHIFIIFNKIFFHSFKEGISKWDIYERHQKTQ